MFSVLREDLRYASRSLAKHPGFALVAVLTLAVGVGANTAIFSVLHAVVLRELPYRDADRLGLLHTINLAQNLPDGSSYLNFRDWKAQSRAFEDMAVYRRPNLARATITAGGETERIDISLVGPGFFQLLGAPPLFGRTIDDADFSSGQRPVVISHQLWRQRFGGDPRVIGQSIIADNVTYEIVGVMPSEFAFPTASVQLWAPITLLPQWSGLQTRYRDADLLMVIGRLRSGVTFEAAQAELDTIAARLRAAHPDTNADEGVRIEPLRAHVLGPRTAGALWLLFGAVGFVLLIACANVANLAFARGALRHHEFSLRTALGASRSRLVCQALTESLLLAALAAGAGLLFAWLAASALRTYAATALPRLDTVRLDATVLLFALVVSLTCGIAAALLPALQSSTANPLDALRETARLAGGHRRRLRHALVIAEVALAVILLSGAGLLIRSFARVQGADRGFDTRNVVLMQLDLPNAYSDRARRVAFYRDVVDRLRALPGVVSVGASGNFFITGAADSRIAPEGQPPRRADAPAPPLSQNNALPGFFEAMRIPLLRGRLLQEADLDPEAPRVVVINETMARQFWPGEDAVGKRFKLGVNPAADQPWTTVVGVVADMRRQKLDVAPIPNLYRAGVPRDMTLAVRTAGDPAALRDAIRAQLRALDPNVPPYGFVTVEQRLGETVALRTLQMALLGALAAAALVLAVIGVYGVIHQSVAIRTQEIGIRMALGASRPAVLRMILTGALGLAAAGLVLGLIGAVALGETIASFLYDTSPLDPLIYASVAAILLGVTTVSCLAPARRASRIDPMSALRAE